MESEKVVKPRRPRRSKADIEEAIYKAALYQIRKKGFSLALVTDIVKRAKIEPIVFYNRYKNLREFYDEFVKEYDYWLADILRDHKEQVPTAEGYSNLIERLLNKLLDDEIMVELLRWEVAEGNMTTERTARLREIHAMEFSTMHTRIYQRDDIDVDAITALLVAGLYYIILHKDRSTISGIDIRTVEGKRRLVNAIRQLSVLIFGQEEDEKLEAENGGNVTAHDYRHNFENACREQIRNDFRDHIEELIRARSIADRNLIADKLREEGVSADIIDRCVLNK